MEQSEGKPYRFGDIARDDIIDIRYHGRIIRGKVYDASEVAIHFKWIGDDAVTSPWKTIDESRDGSADYEQIVRIVDPS